MSLSTEDGYLIPEDTSHVAHAIFPKGNIYLRMYDALGPIYQQADFAHLFSPLGQPAIGPVRLALVCILQFVEGLTDQQAANAVRTRIDWKYLLGLELTDPGFDFSVLSEFRGRLLAGTTEERLLEVLLNCFRERGLLKAHGRMRTDSTHVLGASRRSDPRT